MRNGGVVSTSQDFEEDTDSGAEMQSHAAATDMTEKLAESAITSNGVYQANLGLEQDDESGTDTDEDGEMIKAKTQAAAFAVLDPGARPVAKKRPSGKSGAISMKDLIDEDLIFAGEDVLSVEYKGNITYATLLPEGHILCQLSGKDQIFESPSAFSIALKRLVNPLRKADDGWKTVKYNGKFLDNYKLELARRRLAELESGGLELPSSDEEPPTKKAKVTKSHPDLTERPTASSEAQPSVKRQTEANIIGSNVEDASNMMPCEHFRGEPCSSSRSQPFKVQISPGAALLMDFHAHLSNNEVAGLLGGTWNPELQLLRIERAFPVQEVQSSEGMPGIQMNPLDEKAVKQKMAKNHNLSCVGWYHSHPQAGCHPSMLDINAQVRYQKQHRSPETGLEPFVGAIVSPYGESLANAQSQISFFNVVHPGDRDLSVGADPIAEGCLPMAMDVTEEEGSTTEGYIISMPHHEMRTAVHRCASTSRRADILGVWQETSRLEKLKKSVAARLPRTWTPKRLEEYVTKVEAMIRAAWSVFSQPSVSKQENHAIRGLKAEEEELEISDISAEHGTDSRQRRNGRQSTAVEIN